MTKTYLVAVFVERRKNAWRFSAYLRDYNSLWKGCNLVTVKSQSGKEAKQLAIDSIKARMNLKNMNPPNGIKFYDYC